MVAYCVWPDQRQPVVQNYKTPNGPAHVKAVVDGRPNHEHGRVGGAHERQDGKDAHVAERRHHRGEDNADGSKDEGVCSAQ